MRPALLGLRARGRLVAGPGVRVARDARLTATEGGSIELRAGARLGADCRVDAVGGTISIAEDAAVGERTILVARERIAIGAGATVGDWSILDDAAPAGLPVTAPERRVAPIDVGARAQLGQHVVAGPGTTVASGTEVPAYAVLGRAP